MALDRTPNADGRMTLACDACHDVCWPKAPTGKPVEMDALKMAAAAGWRISDDMVLCSRCNSTTKEARPS